MTSVSNVAADIDGTGYGSKLEVPFSHLVVFAAAQKWTSSVQHKQRMIKFANTASVIALTRDRDSEGGIWVDSNGDARFDWKYGGFDAESTLQGVEAGIKCLVAAGANEVYTSQFSVPDFKIPAGQDFATTLESDDFKVFMKCVRDAGIKVNKTGLFSAHQMGTVRMASDAKLGAVNPHGESFDIKGLYVSDTSVFPTASGVK